MAQEYTTGDWRRLGDRIRGNPSNVSKADYEMLQNLRITYQQPIAFIFTQLENLAQKVDKYCICTYRVKRIESIISKLLRIEEMVISRAEDIAGCRCIVHNEAQVYKLYDSLLYLQEKGEIEIKGGGHDYIKEPKPSGYRSLHVIVCQNGDNRRVEIQIRTLAQHNWAALVETTDVLFNSGLKEFADKKNPDLYEFHKLLSKDNESLSSSEKLRIAEISFRYSYMEKIGSVFNKNYIDVRAKWNRMPKRGKQFILISTGSDGYPDFNCYTCFNEAEKAYFDEFLKNSDSKNIVLTHLDYNDFGKVSIAYSNYILTYNELASRLLKLLSEAVIQSYRKNNIKLFKKYYQYFNDTMSLWLEVQIQDIAAYSKNNKAVRNRQNYEWAYTIKKNIKVFMSIYNDLHKQLRFSLRSLASYFTYLKMKSEFDNKEVSTRE